MPEALDLPVPSVDATVGLKPEIGGAPRPKAPAVPSRPAVHAAPRPVVNQALDTAAATVLPERLNEEAARFFQQALHASQIDKAYGWILQKMSAESDPTALASDFLKRYEDQIANLRGERFDAEGMRYPFRAALVATMLRELARYRMRFADRGFNSVFLETWYKKQLLAAVLGLSAADIDRKIYLSGRTAPVFVNGELHRLLHTTFLARFR